MSSVILFVIAGLDPAIHADSQHAMFLDLHHGKPRTRDSLRGHDEQIVRRVQEHREGLVAGFTKEHSVRRLVYYEEHATAIDAIQREKNIKHWPRQWKLDLIQSMNPEWSDLWDVIVR